ncbi:MAG: hypothetical protein JWO02_3360 [Solirubrobacterales bacterium]|nr:hypothetical protein [Solirubrobacterales bacterium]
MNAGFQIAACARCAHAVWPPRSLCPVCGSPDWTTVGAADGVAEERTETTAPDGTAVCLASVRLAAGPVVIARVTDAAPGDPVHLALEAGALVASTVPGPPARA